MAEDITATIVIADKARDVHLRGALGAVRQEKWHGRETLIIPVVALMDGVIHAVNAETPERVPLDLLERAATSWNNRPLTLGHPFLNGAAVSANDPKVLETQSFGSIFNSRVSGTKLLMDAYVDVEKAEQVGGKEFLQSLQAGKMCEVSVGAAVKVRQEDGEHNGKKFSAIWLEAAGDHLAFLPRGRGACSIEMGCGAHRSAMHLVTAEAISVVTAADIAADDAVAVEIMALETVPKLTTFLRSLMPRGWGDDEVKQDLREALYAVDPAARHGEILRMTNNEVVYCIYPPMSEAYPGDYAPMPQMHYYSRSFSFDTTTQKFAVDGNRKEVEPTTVYVPVRMAAERIRLEGGQWSLYSKDGTRRLGQHATVELAEEHARAIDRVLARQSTT